MTDYLIYDVFTDTPLGGNPLAVIPDATPLADDRLQALAKEFNLSETVFVFPSADPAHTARVRIFTPMQEVPFAGHPTIGTAAALGDLGHGPEMVLELGVGPIPCHAEGGVARFTTRQPLQLGAAPTPAEIAACLGLDPADIAGQPRVASVGLPFAMTELTGPDALARARPHLGGFQACATAYPTDFDFAVYAYIRDGAAVRARMFAPLDGTLEDPATGSAAATLAAMLARDEGAPLTLEIAQGVEMGRPSRIGVSVAADGAVTVSGRAIRVMEGRLLI